MKIKINGADADIQLEAEKTVGEVLCALDAWLDRTEHRLSSVCINNETIGAGSLEACFARDVCTVDTLDLQTSSIRQLLAESLENLLEDIDAYENAGFDDKNAIAGYWKETPEALLLAEQSPDIFNRTVKTFSGEGSNPQALRLLARERLRELHDPAGEIGRIGDLVMEICARLEDLPLDIQTGKDARAAETVNTFSNIAEKVFRIIGILKLEGFPVGEITVGSMPIAAYITEFGSALRELLTAYEQHDTVLVGDLAEYEMAPRLRGLHSAVLGVIEGAYNVHSGS